MPFCPQCGHQFLSGDATCTRCGRELPRPEPMPEWKRKIIGGLALYASLGLAGWWAFVPPRNMFDPSFSLFGRWCCGLAAGGAGCAVLGLMIAGILGLFAEGRASKEFARKTAAQSTPAGVPWRFGKWFVRFVLVLWLAGFGALSYWYILREREQPLRLRGHSAKVTGVVFTRDGKRLFSAADDGTLRAWDLAGGKQLYSVAIGKLPLDGVAFAPDESAAFHFRPEDGQFVHWDTATGKEIGRFKATMVGTQPFWTASGKRTVFSRQNKLVVWDLDNNRQAFELPEQLNAGNIYRMHSVASNLGVRIGTLEMQLWNIETGARLATFQGTVFATTAQANKVICWHPDRKEFLVVAGLDGKELVKLERGGSIRELATMAMTADSRRALVGESAFAFYPVKLWDTERGVEVARYRLDYQNPTCLAVAPDGERFAAGLESGQIVVWNAHVK